MNSFALRRRSPFSLVSIVGFIFENISCYAAISCGGGILRQASVQVLPAIIIQIKCSTSKAECVSCRRNAPSHYISTGMSINLRCCIMAV